MTIRSASINVWRGRAYLPVQAHLQSGAWLDVGPVYSAVLQPDELEAALEQVLALGNPQLPNPTREEMRRRKDPLLAATKARSWYELARTGAAYSISWTDRGVWIEMSRLDHKGRWVWDRAKQRILPPDAPLSEIVAIIPEDVRTRPEVMT